MRKGIWLLWALTCLPAAGCGTSRPEPVDVNVQPNSVVIDLLMQEDQFFRRYHVVREVVWKECGNVREESFAPNETQVSMLTENERREMLKRLSGLLSTVAAGEQFPSAAKDEKNVVVLSIRQEQKASVIRTPTAEVKTPQTNGTRLLADFLALFAQRRDLPCSEAGS